MSVQRSAVSPRAMTSRPNRRRRFSSGIGLRRLLPTSLLCCSQVLGACGGDASGDGPAGTGLQATSLTWTSTPAFTSIWSGDGLEAPLRLQLATATGRAVKQANVAVSVTISSGGGTLAGGTTQSTDAEGVATFADLRLLGTPGVRTLTFSAASLASLDWNVSVLGFTAIGTGEQITCGLASDGRAFCWGAIQQPGGGPPRIDTMPKLVPGGRTFGRIAVGPALACGLTSAGAAFCWGSGHLGDGAAPTTSLAPVAVAGGLDFVAIGVGGEHVCGIASNGRVHCWGFNDEGQLGVGGTSTTSTLAPVEVAGGVTFSTISVGFDFNCGVAAGIGALCWGDDSSFQLGQNWRIGSTTPSIPTAVNGGGVLTRVFAGSTHACGLTGAGFAFCWGTNFLGDGAAAWTESPAPLAVSGGLTFTELSASQQHTCGLTTSSTLHCWGWNSDGQLGDGSMTQRGAPVPVSGDLTFSGISTGAWSTHRCAIGASDGGTYCWGANQYGQLGDGTRTRRLVPTRVRMR